LFQERNVRIRIRILPVVRGQYATRAGGQFADFRPHSDPHFTRCSIRRSACPQIRILPVATGVSQFGDSHNLSTNNIFRPYRYTYSLQNLL